MRKLGQGHCDRLLLVPPGSTQSSPSPTLSSSCRGLPAKPSHDTGDAQRKVGKLGIDSLVDVVVVVVVVVVVLTVKLMRDLCR